MPQQAAFFFGSGISIPSGLPSVADITDAALGDDWHLHTGQIFCHGPNPNPLIPDTVTPLVKAFLVKVRQCAEDYLTELAHSGPVRKPHYEDLFSLSEQAARPETDFVPNLATVEFLRRLRRETVILHHSFTKGTRGNDGFVGIAESACDFLHCVVGYKLLHSGATRMGLDLITEVASQVDKVDIFTLNHDLLIEDQFKSVNATDFETGFDDRSNGSFSVYRAGWWSGPRKKVRLFKLHGSLNWWLYRFTDWQGKGRRVQQYAIPDGDAFHSRDQNGHLVVPQSPYAAFLSGTIVKEMRYGTGIFAELLTGFRSHLDTHTHLICCGYGFGDTGINERLVQWWHDNLDGKRRFVILTPAAPAQYFDDKPLWLIEKYKAGHVLIVPHYLEKCTLADLAPYFDSF